ncbi:Gfo/Idh/MocA family protein [Paenibacillus camelliae]|uniref:Gfo/Idh/MocA family protein n=1 Tax=Paenibacillus camelliae TaxID=512410 RepID=UPI00203E19A9|nr:Gfo/Idh/MocA family oxidoreductase [Paenibacillus camelliae]MCM3635800.1 Gfo/Idh/MocA family oxidoreductase [Paenibacillus camelliae]
MVSFGMIGTNFISDRFIAAGSMLNNFEVTAICSRSMETANSFADKHNIPHRFTQAEEMLDSGLVNALYIASPTNLHAHYAKLALERGIHVLCEKPVTSNSRELSELIKLARSKGILFMEAMKSTTLPAFRQAVEHLEEIGTVRRYFASFCQYSSRYDAYKQGTVLNAFKPEFSNGALMDIGVYCIYPAVVLFGKPKKIVASAYMLESGVDGQGSIILSYDGFDAVIQYSKISSSYLPFEIQGEAGALVLNRVSDPDEITLKLRSGETRDLSQPTVEHDMYYEVEHFISLIEQQKTESPINSFENSSITMEIMDEVRKQIGLVYPADLEK